MHPLAAYLFNSEGKTEDLHSRDLSVQTLPEKPAQLLQNFNTLNAPQRVQIHKLKLANLERWFKSPTFIINLRPKEWRFTGISKGKCQLTGKQRGTSLRIQKHTNWWTLYRQGPPSCIGNACVSWTDLKFKKETEFFWRISNTLSKLLWQFDKRNQI